ncbi:MAG: efflux RND transporter periplasmic adaptor subunit [Rhizobiaceae bacterium]|nr:efflux RND transporter periplasmic adaptor subunit [Rhizobiaceae bacterium]MCV0405330.1 efflux RND transporter periplasmic adaptor subunit [Rhizobiaceae bacterium]
MFRKVLPGLMLATALSVGFPLSVAPALSVSAEEAAEPAPVHDGPSISVVAAETREIVERISVNGTVVPRQEAAVGIDLTGMIVEELPVDEGDVVAKGDLLARLDRSALDTQFAQAEANRAQAEAQIEQTRAQITDAEIGVRQAQEGYDRAKALQDKGVAAKATLDNAVNALDSARARLVSARKALAASEAQLGVIEAQKAEILRQIARTEVRAPVDGLILSRAATLGALVSASSGPLFTMAMDGALELAARIPERDLARVEPGMMAELTVAGASKPVMAEIRRIAPRVDQTSRMGEIRVAMPADAGARAGNFARGEIILSRRAAVSVPAAALVYRDGDAYAQRVEGGVVHTTPVVTGARDGANVEIRSGLQQGDEIIARAGTFVADGDRVTPVRSGEEQVGALKP